MSNVNQLIWFRQDLRVRDHAALWHASQQGPCIGLIILSPEQWKMHHDAPIKINFYLCQLQQLKKELEQLQSQFQAKAAMVASLEAQYLQRQQDFSRQQKIKTVDGIQAKKDASAAYLDKFREKVELYGNRYYPEEAKQQQLRGEVRLMVILNAQGGIRAIRLLESSGHPVLDEAAKSSVRRGAPFGHFDANMKDISELRIVRTWRFDPAEAEFEVH